MIADVGVASSSLSHAIATLTAGRVGDDVLATVVVWIPVISVGFGLTRVLLGSQDRIGDPFSELSVALCLGLVAYGFILLAVGFAPALTRPALVVLAVVIAAGLVWVGRDAVATLTRLWGELRRTSRPSLLLILPAAGYLAAALLAGLRPPFASDEVAYHWPAPVLWAHAGHWITSPYRFTNGFSLAETLYTPAAVFHSPTAAHWTDWAMLVICASATCGLARRFGGWGLLAGAAVLATPAIASEAWLAYDDTFAAAFAVCACVVAALPPTLRRSIVIGVLLAGAVSVKPLMLIFVPLPVLLSFTAGPDGDLRPPLFRAEGVRVVAARLAAMALPGLAACVAWLAYSLFFTGQLFQSNGLVVATFGHDPSHGLATIRIPTVPEIAQAPFLPVATALIGAREPYGGRSSLLLAVGIPVVIASLLVVDASRRRWLARLAVPVVISYAVAAILIVRTRFLLVDYCVGICVCAVVAAWWRQRIGQRSPLTFHAAVALVVAAGLLDGLHHAFS